MLFNSIEFFLLLIFCLIFYWSSQSILWRQNILLISSIIFYTYWFPPYLSLLLILALFTYICSLKIASSAQKWLFFGVSFLLGILGFFKYTNFGLKIIQDTSQYLGIDLIIKAIDIKLPLGISFIVFQLIAYLVDVKRKQTAPEKDLRTFTLFLAFFPQLIAGPICRSNQLIPQLKEKRNFSLYQFTGGLVLIMSGLFLKVGFADGLAPFVDSVFNSSEKFTKANILWATLGFGVQIFCDFWGYSTTAIGTAKLFGIDIPINFDLPYIATSLRGFWRRWHITLSNWLRDYLYIPLGGSRQGKLQTIRNLIITMSLCGLWHGASLTFLLWGLIHGLFLVVERFIADLFNSLEKNVIVKIISQIWVPIGWLITISFVNITWIFFRANNLKDAMAIFRELGNFHTAINYESPPSGFLILLFSFALLHIPISKLINAIYSGKIWLGWRFVMAGWFLILSIVMSSGENIQFIYFQF
ncbi:membrane bound O-acyl transferase MBOAT family protein [Calothrix parasitica NIES-267]|uniref:Membrane bound O-acyl transferase MBOAT family protein n=1 Tax=Calothrix parasitica NIES-267 TaxID=1973488 RepID=A0A1Z4LID0_9CYAN|nr:membrane bound O-acyl transferase MBOAT family protein [Calothrix parasitica NIES-267]